MKCTRIRCQKTCTKYSKICRARNVKHFNQKRFRNSQTGRTFRIWQERVRQICQVAGPNVRDTFADLFTIVLFSVWLIFIRSGYNPTVPTWLINQMFLEKSDRNPRVSFAILVLSPFLYQALDTQLAYQKTEALKIESWYIQCVLCMYTTFEITRCIIGTFHRS